VAKRIYFEGSDASHNPRHQEGLVRLRFLGLWLMLLRFSACLAVVLALALAGCGGSGNEVASTQPTIPRPVAEDLAARAAEVARLLDRGDSCAAAQKTRELQRATSRAITSGTIPPELRGALLAAVRDLADRIDCSDGEETTTGETASTPTTTSTQTTTTTGTTTPETTTVGETTTSVTTTSG
jgi:hypothetical protein